MSPNFYSRACEFRFSLDISREQKLLILQRVRSVLFFSLQYINDLANNIDVQEMLIRAEQLCLQLYAYPDLPGEVKLILTGKNEAMMTPNVERPDPFLAAHSRHVVNLLEDYGGAKASSAVQRCLLAAINSDESSKQSSSGNSQTDLNDLDAGSARSSRNDGASNENQTNEEVVSDEDEIVVLSEEAQNIF